MAPAIFSRLSAGSAAITAPSAPLPPYAMQVHLMMVQYISGYIGLASSKARPPCQ